MGNRAKNDSDGDNDKFGVENYGQDASDHFEINDVPATMGHRKRCISSVSFGEQPIIYSMSSSINESSDKSQSIVGTFVGSIIDSVRRLQKTVGCSKGFAIVIGIVFGSGIFVSPSLVLKETDDIGLSLLVWLTSGLIVILGSMCYCDLGTSINKTGGSYAYANVIYGPMVAFLISWVHVLIIDPTCLAGVGLTVGSYVMGSFQEIIVPNPWYPKAVSSFCILLFAALNCASLEYAGRIQSFFTLSQVISVLFIIALGIYQMSLGKFDNFKNIFQNTTLSWDNIGGVGTAFYGSLWAYNGWQLIGNVTEEMIDVEKNLFLAAITGIIFIIFSYFGINLTLLTALTKSQISASNAVAVTFARNVIGEKPALIMPILITLSCFGATNGSMYLFSRVSLAAGKDGQFPKFFGMIHKTRNTPIPSVLLLVAISHVFMIPDSSSLQALINLCSLSIWVVLSFVFLGVIVFRLKQPHVIRPFKVWLIVPVFMFLVSIMLIVVSFIERPISSCIAIGIIGLAIPIYVTFILYKNKHPTWFKTLIRRINLFVKSNLNLANCA